ncbi:TetR/AcrR family transcriptional regulator [Novosphingobium bradum]|uniref:TetR/AcrR family transcriptional regulator n=1 Tax=Novosphingobium bradum TaxID=1737444 RepID=A0ABV7IN10_9SPHN
MERREIGRAGRPRATDVDTIEQRVLDRAWALFLEGGYGAVTYEALAHLERMSKQTIYSRFPNKEALFEAAAVRQIKAWTAQIAHAVEGVPGDPLRKSVEATFRSQMQPESRALLRLMRDPSIKLAALRRLTWSSYEEYRDRLTARIRQGRPQLPVGEAQVIAAGIIDMISGHSARARDFSEAELDQYLALWTPRMVALAERLAGAEPALPH